MYHNIRDRHSLSNKEVLLKSMDKKLNGKVARVEDWCCNFSGSLCDTCGKMNWACVNYAKREVDCKLPMDNETVYVKVNNIGYIVHSSEIQEIKGLKKIIKQAFKSK